MFFWIFLIVLSAHMLIFFNRKTRFFKNLRRQKPTMLARDRVHFGWHIFWESLLVDFPRMWNFAVESQNHQHPPASFLFFYLHYFHLNKMLVLCFTFWLILRIKNFMKYNIQLLKKELLRKKGKPKSNINKSE